MQKNWLRVFLLCVVCAFCLQVNCSAGNHDDNWVKYYEDRQSGYFVNENFANVREYNGRKYLELATKRNSRSFKPHLFTYQNVLFDVERNTSIHLLTDSKISAIELTKTGSLPLAYQALLRWAERKYPTLINELREHNRNHPLQIEEANAPIAGSGMQKGDLNAEAAQIQKWLQEGKTSAYNAGIGFEWWDEKAKADFEALPFSNDIAEVCSHVYRLPDYYEEYENTHSGHYVVIVPQHAIVHYGDDEQDTFDTLLMVEIATYYEKEMKPSSPWDLCFVKNGQTDPIVHFEDSKPFEWTKQPKTSWKHEGTVVNTLGDETVYTFEATKNPTMFIAHAYTNYVDPQTKRGKVLLEVLPGITLPSLPDDAEE